jgi:hypothetical protein
MSDYKEKTNILKEYGYIKGYEQYFNGTDWRFKRDESDNEIGVLPQSDLNQNMLDTESNYFKYGMEKNKDNNDYNLFWLDDPTILSFNIHLDGKSPLFLKDENKQSLSYFLKQYGESISEIEERKKLHVEFIKKLSDIFYIDGYDYDNNQGPRKFYYINKLDGLHNLMKKIIKYGNKDSDVIKLELQEDVTLSSFYLAELYNNLVYSYKNQRYIAPHNLFRFNMTINIQEIRNFVIPGKQLGEDYIKSEVNKRYAENRGASPFSYDEERNKIREELRTNNYMIKSPVSTYTIKLYDCNFDFFNSNSVSEHITQAGFNAGRPTDISFLTGINIYYKSAQRILNTELIPGSYTLDNRSSKFKKIDESDNKDELDLLKERSKYKEYSNPIGTDNRTLNGLSSNYRGNLFQRLKDGILTDLEQNYGNYNRQINTIIDSAIGENFRRLGEDIISGDFGLLEQQGRNFLTNQINALRRQSLMKLNDFVDGIKGNKWQEEIVNGERKLEKEKKYPTNFPGETNNEEEIFVNYYDELEGKYNRKTPIDNGGDRYTDWRNDDKEQIFINKNDELEGEYNRKIPEDTVYKEEGPINKFPEGAVYKEKGPIYKPASGVIYRSEGPINKLPEGEVYQEEGPIYKPADGEVYQENGPIYKPADGEVYQEEGTIYKPADGEVYQEEGTIYKPADGEVYQEEGPIYKPANGEVYQENGPIYKPADGEVYQENGPIYKPADGEVYQDEGYIYKPADGEVYQAEGHIYKPADGEVYQAEGHIYKPADGEVYQENGPIYKPADGEVYQVEGHIYKPADGEVYQENGPIYKPADGEVYQEEGPIYKPADGEVYQAEGPIYKPANGEVYQGNGPIYKYPNSEHDKEKDVNKNNNKLDGDKI